MWKRLIRIRKRRQGSHLKPNSLLDDPLLPNFSSVLHIRRLPPIASPIDRAPWPQVPLEPRPSISAAVSRIRQPPRAGTVCCMLSGMRAMDGPPARRVQGRSPHHKAPPPAASSSSASFLVTRARGAGRARWGGERLKRRWSGSRITSRAARYNAVCFKHNHHAHHHASSSR